MVTIRLESPNASLRLTTGDASWCELSLEVAGKSIELGGDSFARVRDGLLRFLGGEGPQAPAGEIDGVPVTWVMSLMEKHTSLYGADSAEGRMLMIQGTDGASLAKLALDRAQCGVWRKMLAESELNE
jgi:hypothetical protein